MRVLLVSNMYPDERHPSYGIFVKRFADELENIGIFYDCSVMFQQDGKINRILGYISFYLKTFLKTILGTYDVIYIHYASHSSVPVLAAMRLRKLNVYTNVHGSDVVPENSRQVKMQKYTKAILAKSRKVIVPSEYFKEYVSNKYGLEQDKIFVYPSAGVDKKIFYLLDGEEVRNARKKFGFEDGLTAFGMAGRISADKGWNVFVRAVKIVTAKGIKANFVIVGSGNEGKQLDALIKESGMEGVVKRIAMLPQTELCRFYNAIDYLVFPTKREGESLGLVAIEAMSCGTPVIASDYAAPKDYIKDGVNGYKFEMGNAKALAEIIEHIIKTNKENVCLRLGAMETAKEYEKNNVRLMLNNIISI